MVECYPRSCDPLLLYLLPDISISRRSFLVHGREERTPGLGALFVTRAKYAISFFKPVQGSVPRSPMPILDVAATMRVRSGRGMAGWVSADVVMVLNRFKRIQRKRVDFEA